MTFPRALIFVSALLLGGADPEPPKLSRNLEIMYARFTGEMRTRLATRTDARNSPERLRTAVNLFIDSLGYNSRTSREQAREIAVSVMFLSDQDQRSRP